MTLLTDHFHPPPKSVELTDGVFELPPAVTIQVGSESTRLLNAATRLQAVLEQLGSKVDVRTDDASSPATIQLMTDADLFNESQAYRLEIDRHRARVVGADIVGTVYGVSTLIQCLTGQRHQDIQRPVAIECLQISDWPDFVVRGVLLDVSRDRVPKMETLLELIDLLASWKINQIQLYMEHTFAYVGHEIVWKDADPFTAEEIRIIDRYCYDRCIELVPNQNSFGHFHKWLIHEAYRPLAECPEGVKHPFSEKPEPFSLCAIDPNVLDLLGDLYDQLLPNFRSALLNVGLDETFDLGMGRSEGACLEKGKGSVYLEYLKEVHRLVETRGHQMQFWADILLKSPEVVGELPKKVIPLEWGYEANHPFEKHGDILASTGLDFYFCPGTSSWNSLSGRTTNAIENLCLAATSGKIAGARGYLITDWGDFGHMQPPTVSLSGFLIGAGCAWNASMASDPVSVRSLAPSLVDRLVFDSVEPGFGELILSLGDTYKQTGAEIKNGSLLFFLLVFAAEPLTHPRFDKLNKAGLEAARGHVERLRSNLAGFGTQENQLDLPRREMEWVAGMLLIACKLGIERLELGRQGLIADLSTSVRSEIRNDLTPLVDEYRWLWSQSSRPGGLSSSSARLERLLALLG